MRQRDYHKEYIARQQRAIAKGYPSYGSLRRQLAEARREVEDKQKRIVDIGRDFPGIIQIGEIEPLLPKRQEAFDMLVESGRVSQQELDELMEAGNGDDFWTIARPLLQRLSL